VSSSTPQGDGVRVGIHTGDLDLRTTRVGDSVAVNGCCLTVVAKAPDALDFDASAETLRCTTGFPSGVPVNLELALRVGDALGGHLMSGHVDGIGRSPRSHRSRVTPMEAAPRDRRAGALAPLIAAKGSIAVAGVSLTVNDVWRQRFAVNLIPHTLSATTLRELAVGVQVNLEADQLARYVARLREFER
jgi:riboflavin synthase